MAALDKVERETGKKAFYALNVTAGADVILERAAQAVDHNANMAMIDVLTAGFSALEQLSKSLKVPVHMHRTMHGAFTRDKGHGISMLFISKLVRMCGGTNLHTGSYMGKMAGETQENDLSRDALRKDWHGYKKVFPVASRRDLTFQSLWKPGRLRHRLHSTGRRWSARSSRWDHSRGSCIGPGRRSLAKAYSPPGICKRPQRAGYSFKILGILRGSIIPFPLS